MVPELFNYEINKLGFLEREKYQKRKVSYQRADGEQIEQDDIDNLLLQEEKNQLSYDKIRSMEMYLYDQSKDLYSMYVERLSEEIEIQGHGGFDEYMMMLELRDEDKLKPVEKMFLEEVAALREIHDDIKVMADQIEIRDSELEMQVPEWIMDEKIKDQFKLDMKYIEKYLTIDIKDTGILPPTPNRGPDFDERLQIATDGNIEELIDADRKKLKELANSGKPLLAQDPNKKDDDLISRMNIIAQAVKVIQPPTLETDLQSLYSGEEQVNPMLAVDKRIRILDIYRVLKLNNDNPELYNI